MKWTFIIVVFMLGHQVLAQDFKLFKGDTINVLDVNNKRQGLWMVFDGAGDRVLEKGRYIDSKKDGLWIQYYATGSKKHEITYKQGKAVGNACFYYPDGKVSEKGFWNIDHWEGEYKFYHTTGQLAYDWNYDLAGKRTGEQRYYHENGELKYTGKWERGKTVGALQMYNEQGQLIAERVYEGGEFASLKQHDPSTIADNQTEPQAGMEQFTGTGMHTIYTLEGQPERKGFFVRGKLFNGQHFVYDNEGKLLKINHYENGVLKRTEEPGT